METLAICVLCISRKYYARGSERSPTQLRMNVGGAALAPDVFDPVDRRDRVVRGPRPGQPGREPGVDVQVHRRARHAAREALELRAVDEEAHGSQVVLDRVLVEARSRVEPELPLD